MNGNSATNRFSVKKSGSPSKHQDKTNLIGDTLGDTHDDEVIVVSAPGESQSYQNSSGAEGGGSSANPMLSSGQNYGSVHNNGHEKKIKQFFSRHTSGKKPCFITNKYYDYNIMDHGIVKTFIL